MTVLEVVGAEYALNKGVKGAYNSKVTNNSVGRIELNSTKSTYKPLADTSSYIKSTGSKNVIKYSNVKTGAYSSSSNYAGNELGKLAAKELNVSEKGLNIISQILI